jgi:hypothetical protein
LQKLKVLLILLVVATSGLAVSIYLLALIFGPAGSPIAVLYHVVTGNFPSGLSFLIPLSSLLFLSTVLASMVGVIYFLVLPEMKDYYSSGSEPVGRGATAMVMRTLKPDERKVVDILKVHGGSYVQKFITREAGLSRLKTHRVVATLAERGIVYVEKKGNSNDVTLAKWFLEGMEG